MNPANEVCRNPIRPNCGGQDIAVYIFFKGSILPICRRCWRELVELDFEWGRSELDEELEARIEAARRILCEREKMRVSKSKK